MNDDVVTIPLSPEAIETIVLHSLKQSYEMTQIVNDEDEAEFDVDFLYCLNRVIEYYSSPTDYEAWQESIRG